jgi:hypothetical protein
MTGIEPALSAWERDPGCADVERPARSSWFFVAEAGACSLFSYIWSYTRDDGTGVFDLSVDRQIRRSGRVVQVRPG